MALAEAVKTVEPTYTINDSMNVLLEKLDEAIDDMENGRVQTIDEAWEEIDRVWSTNGKTIQSGNSAERKNRCHE